MSRSQPVTISAEVNNCPGGFKSKARAYVITTTQSLLISTLTSRYLGTWYRQKDTDQQAHRARVRHGCRDAFRTPGSKVSSTRLYRVVLVLAASTDMDHMVSDCALTTGTILEYFMPGS